MQKIWLAFMVGAAVAGLAWSPAARASDAPVVLDNENANCNQLTVNSIKELKVTSIMDGIAMMGTQKIDIDFDGTKIKRWEVVGGVNVNAVIVKGAGSGTRVYHFGQNGSLVDEDVPSPGGAITQVRFCYGLQGASTVSNPPSCNSVGITCSGDKVVFVFELNQKFFDLQPCTCSANSALTVCNPNATAASDTAAALPACVSGGVLTEVPTVVEGVKNPDTFFCTVVGGKRTCYNR